MKTGFWSCFRRAVYGDVENFPLLGLCRSYNASGNISRLALTLCVNIERRFSSPNLRLSLR